MNRSEPDRDVWPEAVGGFRGSRFLMIGAAVFAAAALLNLYAGLFLAGDPGPYEPLLVTAWLMHILALWLIALGFGWTGTHPFMTRFGLVPAGLHTIQGIFLLIILFTSAPAAIPPVSLTTGRLLATMIFAVVETHDLGRRTTRILLVTAGLQMVKVLARTFGLIPDMGAPLDPALDAIMAVQLAVGLYQTGLEIGRVEDAFARANQRTGSGDLSEFNNPEHTWNKK